MIGVEWLFILTQNHSHTPAVRTSIANCKNKEKIYKKKKRFPMITNWNRKLCKIIRKRKKKNLTWPFHGRGKKIHLYNLTISILWLWFIYFVYRKKRQGKPPSAAAASFPIYFYMLQRKGTFNYWHWCYWMVSWFWNMCLLFLEQYKQKHRKSITKTKIQTSWTFFQKYLAPWRVLSVVLFVQ